MVVIELDKLEKFEKAAVRANKEGIEVQFVEFRKYQANSSDGFGVYNIQFWTDSKTGACKGHCTCKGGQGGLVCKHLAKALEMHLKLARQVYEEQQAMGQAFLELGKQIKAAAEAKAAAPTEADVKQAELDLFGAVAA